MQLTIFENNREYTHLTIPCFHDKIKCIKGVACVYEKRSTLRHTRWQHPHCVLNGKTFVTVYRNRGLAFFVYASFTGFW